MKMVYKMIMCWVIFNWLVMPISSLKRSLVVLTRSGPVKGKLNNYNGSEYYSYHGIPYAESPLGPLRFMPPVPRKPWTTVLDASQEGPVCMQVATKYEKYQMSEDCLNVNVYVPAIRCAGTDELLPVLVLIHGGGMHLLSGNSDYIYGPQLILQREIIFVSMNYRLGPLGFLSLGIEEASGNAGLKDILLCLKWVNQNIREFGGNPNKVTIIGHSSGSALAHYLMFTKKSVGLFQQVVLLSGSALSPRSFARHPKEVAILFARKLGIQTNNVFNILKYLQEIDVFDLLDEYKNMTISDDSIIKVFSPFVPTAEIESAHAVVTMDPVQFFRENGTLPLNIPILAGIVAEEGVSKMYNLERRSSEIQRLCYNSVNLIPSNIEYPIGSQLSKDLGRSINKMYFGSGKNCTPVTLANYITDTQYIYGINYWIKKYTSITQNHQLYYFIFDFVGDLNWSKIQYNIKVPGTAHSDEVGYFFITNVTKTKIEAVDARSRLMMDTTLTLLSNFIYYGHPSPNGYYRNVRWPEYNSDETYLHLSENLSVNKFRSSKLCDRIEFWENVYNKYYKYVETGGEIEFKIIP